VPEDHVAGLRIRPLEAAHADLESEAARGSVAVSGYSRLERVVEVVVHHAEALLVGRRPLAEVAVPLPDQPLSVGSLSRSGHDSGHVRGSLLIAIERAGFFAGLGSK
jgi:hypothetical protein